MRTAFFVSALRRQCRSIVFQRGITSKIIIRAPTNDSNICSKNSRTVNTSSNKVFTTSSSSFHTTSTTKQQSSPPSDDTTNNDQQTHPKHQKLLESILSSSALAKRIQRMASRHDDIMTRLHSPSSSSNDDKNNNNSMTTGGGGGGDTNELTSLARTATLYIEFISLADELHSMEELHTEATQEGDDDMITECQTEITTLQTTLDTLGQTLIDATCRQLQSSSSTSSLDSDAIVELRAGTGGEEASLFCAELLQTYQLTAGVKGWGFEVLNIGKNDVGGVREAAISITSRSGGGGGYGGDDGGAAMGPYGYYKFESGVHRVQRVPINDVRIHTSAASVAVLPALAVSTTLALPMADLKIETMRASGAGGQHVNTTDSAVRITHIPTGIVASIQDERSQHKNRAKAIKLITARVTDRLEGEERKRRGEERSGLMGGGGRSERVRTYNYPQDRVTDHRCKQSEYGIGKLMGDGGEDGLVGAFMPYLKVMERDELLMEIEAEEENT